MDILAVVVRYKTPLAESETLRGLAETVHAHPHLLKVMRILIWDNSPEPLTELNISFSVEYRHSERNMGVSGAYNGALPIAESMGARWILLLDQDTAVTESFLLRMMEYAIQLAPRAEIAAIMPTVLMGEAIVSPRRMLFNSNRPYKGPSGLASGEAIGANSGMFIRVEALRLIGGFSLEFWLDFSDLYVLHEFFIRGLRVWRAADVELQHSISILDYDNLMPPWRYINFIEAEGAYNDLYKGWFENSLQTLRLWVRAVRQRMRYKNPEFSRITWRHLWHRLTTNRKRRLALWRHTQRSRFAPAAGRNGE
jgi:GT2 family glycosyltransferase